MFKGTLIPIGGNEDKGSGEAISEFVKEGILSVSYTHLTLPTIE